MKPSHINKPQKNVLGTDLQLCGCNPNTGSFRDGFCNTSKQDVGLHIICAIMTDDFLAFTKQQGNDLSTPNPDHQFPGLKEGDRWCLCISRWLEAMKVQKAPPVVLEACHESALEFISLQELRKYTYQ